jgi:hypothetical protein
MNVFVLCTGRSGSSGFIEACKHITNFTAAHESLSKETGQARFQFPQRHIEADNRLSWQLGELDKIYGKDAFYVHLTRNKEATAKSFMNRFLMPKSMIYAYANGIKKRPPEILTHTERFKICLDYVETVNTNIEVFLKDKPHQLSVELEDIKTGFRLFWKNIKADGNLDKALNEFDIKHNSNPKQNIDPSYSFKHAILKSKLFLDQLFKF